MATSGSGRCDWYVAVTFGLSEGVVDELISMTHGSDSEALRWVVFGTNAAELSRLDMRWSPHVHLTLILVSEVVTDASEAVATILEAEGISALECALIQDTGTALMSRAGFGLVIETRGRDALGVVSEMRRWASMPSKGRHHGGTR